MRQLKHRLDLPGYLVNGLLRRWIGQCFCHKLSVLTARSFTLTKKIHLPKFELSLIISGIALPSPYKKVGFAG